MVAVVPVILGEGIPLFAQAPKLHSLELIETKPYPSGIVMLTYRSNPAD
jgi:dihydrofolate reductase